MRHSQHKIKSEICRKVRHEFRHEKTKHMLNETARNCMKLRQTARKSNQKTQKSQLAGTTICSKSPIKWGFFDAHKVFRHELGTNFIYFFQFFSFPIIYKALKYKKRGPKPSLMLISMILLFLSNELTAIC